MHSKLRTLYNASYTPELYQRYLHQLESTLHAKIPFRVAETPLFLPKQLREQLAQYAEEIVDQISKPELIKQLESIVPERYWVPKRDALSNCVQVDFAITRDEQGQLTGKVVELQGFASLYALMVVQTDTLIECMRSMPGLDRKWTQYYGGLNREGYISKLKKAILADCAPEEVVLLDLNPEQQKTYVDFIATHQLIGIDAVCPSELKRDGRKLLRKVNGKFVQIRRIYNRIVFDELEAKPMALPFSYNEDLDVTWFAHPNWYWIWSKYTLPFIQHQAVPKAYLLSQLSSIPEDLSHYVLKPLFSFAGAGVKVEPTQKDLLAIPKHEKNHWLLQEKIEYTSSLLTPENYGVKAEIRMMFLRTPEEEKPHLVINLVRLSRGKMLGVDHNRDFDWVGGSVGIWPEDEES